MPTDVTDRIQKSTVLRAPRARVWRALTTPAEFGAWFGVTFETREFTPGAAVRGAIAPTQADAEVAKMQEPYTGLSFDITIDRLEPERLFSFRWHPFAIEPGVDYSKEPTTLIEFTLEDHPDGTKLTVTESGFDKIPLERRAKAFTANEQGWGMQMTLVAKYLATHAA